jgi:protein-S-isoprenylcysteine O-methyltransferase Ste14
MGSRAVQGVILLVALVVAGVIVVSLAKNLADWIVFGVIVLTFFGAAIAIYPRQYTAKRRTFVKTTKPPR